MPPIMRALVLGHPGGPAALFISEVPDPLPGPTEVLIQVTACGFCHHDLLVMKDVLRRGVKPGVILGQLESGGQSDNPAAHYGHVV